MEGFITREDDGIEPSVFLSALAELEQRRSVNEIERSGSFVT